MNKISQLGYDITYRKEKNLTVNEDIKDVEVLVCYNPFETLDISLMPNLKWIALSSIGIDHAPLDYIIKNKINLTNNKGGYSIPIGEWIVLKVLELLKKSKEFYSNQFNSAWKLDSSILELYGKTIGFIGTGSIAIEACKRLQGFGVNILGVNTSGKSVDYFNKCYSIDKLHSMLPLCDIVVISLPSTEKTHHLINETSLSKFKDNSYLINISRGNIIDENALVNYLKNGKLSGAHLDVFEKEPLEKDSLLWNLDNVSITPHNSWVSEMRNTRRFETILENMKRFKNSDKLINIVDIEKGY